MKILPFFQNDDYQFSFNDLNSDVIFAAVHQFKVRNINLLRTTCPYYLTNDHWTPDSLNLNLWLYTMAGVNSGSYYKRHLKPKTIVELHETLQMIWDTVDRLPRRQIDKAVEKFSK